jgi:hypothetical protein
VGGAGALAEALWMIAIPGIRSARPTAWVQIVVPRRGQLSVGPAAGRVGRSGLDPVGRLLERRLRSSGAGTPMTESYIDLQEAAHPEESPN